MTISERVDRVFREVCLNLWIMRRMKQGSKPPTETHSNAVNEAGKAAVSDDEK